MVGLDIGSKTIKAAEITDTSRGKRLDSFGMIDIAPGLIEEGAIKDPEPLAEAIRLLMKNHRIREQNVAVAIGGYSVIVKPIQMDMMTDEQLEETINIEAEQYIPFNSSDVNIDCHRLGESKTSPNKMDVLLVAAKIELVNDYINLIHMAGLNPCIIDHELTALQNIFEMSHDSGEESVAIIDIGASKTHLNIVKEGVPILVRDVPFGCGQMDEKIMSLSDCGHEEAEAIRRGEETDKISSNDLRDITATVVRDWSIEIGRALDFFYSNHPDDRIETIYLSGGGAHVKELPPMLSDETTTDVEILDPLSRLAVNSEGVDADYLDGVAPQAAICLGLALRRVDDK